MMWHRAISDWAGLVANIGTVIIVVTTISVFWLTHSPRFRNYQLRRPLRRALTQPRKWGLPDIVERLGYPKVARSNCEDVQAWVHTRRKRSAERRELERVIYRPIFDCLNGDEVLPADVVSYFLGQNAYVSLGPWEGVAADLQRVMRSAGSLRLTPVLTRVLFPDEAKIVRQMLTDVAIHLGRFGSAEPVSVERFKCQTADLQPPGETLSELALKDDSPPVGSFSQFATALSGALVLVDSVETRSRYADDVLLWHRRLYRGVAHTPDEVASSHGVVIPPVPRRTQIGCSVIDSDDGYRAVHGVGGRCGYESDAKQRMVGDFDRRVITLRSVSLGEASEQGRLSIVLDTSESCYLATEQGDLLLPPDAPSWRRVGCKHLAAAGGSAGSKQFLVQSNGQYGVDVMDPDEGPVVLLTSYVSLITRDGDLVLTRRSGQVRHGTDVVSATAGGIIEPDGNGKGGDVDALGMPSPLSGVLRETMEEIGVDLTAHPVRPVCVFLSNIRNQSGPRQGRGQLVAAVLYLATLPVTSEEVNNRLHFADPSLGRFEVDHLEVVGRGGPTSQFGHESFSKAAARFAREHASSLDQHGLLSCLYTAAVLDGPDSARLAFQSEFADRPWWSVEPMTDQPEMTVSPRLVRDPRALLKSGEEPVGIPLECVVPSWAPYWSELPKQLDAEGRIARST